ncbi:hypothetical protein KFE25_012095 [Diacronema lutheri]|uniref:Uncharacterized protein n=1 Tax=Diacronema lutheri TaxID=2081491 RepID=A0A8J6CA54_DIALT|nr:hypothetical protein KFE25_012095 [Diacronema lutheri]
MQPQALTAKIVYPVPANVTFSRYAAAASGPLERRLLARNATAEPQLVRVRAPRSSAFSLALGDGAELALDASGLTRVFEVAAGATLAFVVRLHPTRDTLATRAPVDDVLEVHTRKYAHTVPLLARAEGEVEPAALVGRVDTELALLGGPWALPGAHAAQAAPVEPVRRAPSLGAQLRARGHGHGGRLADFEAELTPVAGVSDAAELAFYAQLVSTDVRARATTGAERAHADAGTLAQPAPPAIGGRPGEGTGAPTPPEQRAPFAARPAAAPVGGGVSERVVEALPRHRVLATRHAPEGTASAPPPPADVRVVAMEARAMHGGGGWRSEDDADDHETDGVSPSADAERAPPAQLTAVHVSEDAELDFYKALLTSSGTTREGRPAAAGRTPGGDGGPRFLLNGVLLDARGRPVAAAPDERARVLQPRGDGAVGSTNVPSAASRADGTEPHTRVWGHAPTLAPHALRSRAGAQTSVAKPTTALSQREMDANWDAIG